jgi:hypothetical protein
MRVVWTLGFCLAVLAALIAIAIGATYLSVNAGSLPAILGKVTRSTARRSERGFFAVMLGSVLLLVAIVLNQFRPDGALSQRRDRQADDPRDEASPRA